jgi:hypothetical protein
MTKGRRIEGPRAPLFFSIAALLLLSGGIATAQTVDISKLEQCAGLATDELKLACFEAIITNSKTPESPAPGATDSAESEPPMAAVAAVPDTHPAAEAMPQEAPAVEAATDSTPATVAVSSAPVVVATEPPVEVMPQHAPAVAAAPESTPAAVATSSVATAVTPEPSAATVTATPETLASSRLGEEHLDQPATEEVEDKDEVFHATVTEVAKGRNKILYFRFDNGQVWRQLEARTLIYPKSGDFDITITRGMMGDYRMRIGDNGRMVRIRRVK